MWVRKLSGKQTGLIVEMADHAAEAEIATGVAERAPFVNLAPATPDEPENDLLAELLKADAVSDAAEAEAEEAPPVRTPRTKRRRKSAS